MNAQQRPDISTIQSAAELRQWYWLKAELVAFCRKHQIPYGASKFELLNRVAHYLDTGVTPQSQRSGPTSTFDWANAVLTRETVITDNYKNNQNMRRFMTAQIGPHFRFNNDFMHWMRSNVGKTLDNAVEQWQALAARSQDDEFEGDIPDHNQYNQYLRDFFAVNPTLTMREARRCWEYRRSQPSSNGRHRYTPGDLAALDMSV